MVEGGTPRAARFSGADPGLIATAAETMSLCLVEVKTPDAGRKSEVGARSSSGCDFLHVGSGKGRSKNPKQVVTCSAVCCPVQIAFKVTGDVCHEAWGH